MLKATARGGKRGQIAEARQTTSRALNALAAVHQAQVSAEYGKWKNW
jgi:hypothetical protein